MTEKPEKHDQTARNDDERPEVEKVRLRDLELGPGMTAADQIRGASYKCPEVPPSSL
jgi:hypothetical protein